MQLHRLFPKVLGTFYNENHEEEKKKLIDCCYNIKKVTKSGGDDWISNSTYNTGGTKNLYDDGNKFNTKRAAEYLSTKDIALKGKDNEKFGKIVGIPGNFTVRLNITGKQLKALIGQLDAYSRTSNFSSAKSPVNQEPVVLKSWMDLLRA